MKLELDSEQIFDIITEWCKEKHGWEVNALQWQVEEGKKFEGVIILYGPE